MSDTTVDLGASWGSSGGVTYAQIGSTQEAKVVSSSGATGAVVIANAVTVGGVNYPVKLIEPDAFRSNSNITSIYVSSNVTTIGSFAFAQSANLSSITGMAGVIAVDGHLIFGTQVTSITLPSATLGTGYDGIVGIRDNAFFRGGLILLTINLGVDMDVTSLNAVVHSDAFYNSLPTAGTTINVIASRLAEYSAGFTAYTKYFALDSIGYTMGTYTPTSSGGGGAGGGAGGGGVACFPTGTKILTAGGYKAVEKLAAEDHIITADGRAVPFKLYATRIAKATKETAPYAIKAGAFGRAGPSADIKLSPLHAIQSAKGVWQIPKYAAAMNAGVQQYGVGESVTYYHVELPNFFTDNIVAEGGAVVESYGAKQCAGMKNVYKYNATLGGFTRSAKSASKAESK